MRALCRNKQTIYFANFVSKSAILDDDGLSTGEFENTYTTPTEAKVNVSASRGSANVELFGTDINYTNTIVSDKDLGIDENSILWIGVPSTSPHNYIVVTVAKSLNSVTYAIRKVDVSQDASPEPTPEPEVGNENND